jgi:hypothetical protein
MYGFPACMLLSIIISILLVDTVSSLDDRYVKSQTHLYGGMVVLCKSAAKARVITVTAIRVIFKAGRSARPFR